MTLNQSQQEKLAQHTIKALQVTRQQFEREGKLRFAEAHVIYFDEAGELHLTLMALDMPDPLGSGRKQMAAAVQGECLLRDAAAVLFVSEVWALIDATEEEKRKYPDWSKNPKRREAVMAILETYQETVFAIMPILRRKHGKAEKTFEIVPLDRADLTGTFSHFLPFRTPNTERHS